MDSIVWMPVIVRWLHLMAVVVAVGGAIFMWVALKTDNPGQREEIMRRWRGVVHGAIGVLLLTGFYNFMKVMATKPPPLYQTLFGTKFLMACTIFALVFLLTSKRELAGFNKHRRCWQTLTIVLGTVVVFISMILQTLSH